MALGLFFSIYSYARFGYNVLTAHRPLQALAFGTGYAAGTRIGYNAFGFLQPYRSRRTPRPFNLNTPFSRPRRRMGYYRRSYGSRRRRSSMSAFYAGLRAGRRQGSMRRRRRYRRY